MKKFYKKKNVQITIIKVSAIYLVTNGHILLCICGRQNNVSYRCVLSHVQLFVALWTVAHQSSLPMEFPRQE